MRSIAAFLRLNLLCVGLLCIASSPCYAQNRGKSIEEDAFRQLNELWATPNGSRTASGAPGQHYWQQKVDYNIKVRLDDAERAIHASETVVYHNRSPHSLRYLWLQVDVNYFDPNGDRAKLQRAPKFEDFNAETIQNRLYRKNFDGSSKITKVIDRYGKALKYTINKTMMRIDLPQPLLPGHSTQFAIHWHYKINDKKHVSGRTGYEKFDENNIIYELAHWFPRLCTYTDNEGWQNKQFMGRGEFALEFGDYTVEITVPADHQVAATGELQNPKDVLNEIQLKRLAQAKTAKQPVFIVTPEEAKKTEKAKKSDEEKTWKFQAFRVRDFAWASSRKFIWDAQGHKLPSRDVLAMSFYPKEAEPLWSKYSTKAIIHTLNVYSRYTFDYPYPVCISVNGPVWGMEYPMICFNGPRPEKDGTYQPWQKYSLISIIIHEVGHNYFPMIVNSDERQWTWMDEGLNTFLQCLAEAEWSEKYPSRRGEPRYITGYMRSENQVPIMTNSESIKQFGNNAYAKPATALNILRETIMGRELFDFAFKEYAQRWKFKHPTPEDFFRTMEDASGVDLDWFWRGWFYTTKPCDIGITKFEQWQPRDLDPEKEKPLQKQFDERNEAPSISKERNKKLPKYVDKDKKLLDFYDQYDQYKVDEIDRQRYRKLKKKLSKKDKDLIKANYYFYVVTVENKSGLPMPLIFQLHYEDGKTEIRTVPAEVWRRGNKTHAKLFILKKPVKRIVLDPYQQTADIDLTDNVYPPEIGLSRFSLFRQRQDHDNPMRRAKKAEEMRAKRLAREKRSKPKLY